MTQPVTDWLQQSRLTVVHVDPGRGHLRVKGTADACTDLTCSAQAVVIVDGEHAGLEALNPGDIVRVEPASGPAERVIVVRRVWDELTSPEF